MKEYTLEEALPLVRQGREFKFDYGGGTLRMTAECGHGLEVLLNVSFTLMKAELKDFNDLDKLDCAMFKGFKVEKDTHGVWDHIDGQELVFDKSTYDIKNWSYLDED